VGGGNIMGLFESKVKGKTLAFTIKIKNMPPYPTDDMRKSYIHSLWPIFSPFYNGPISVLYKKSDKEMGKLTGVMIICFEPKFSFKKSTERTDYNSMFNILSDSVKRFFKSLNIEAVMEGVYVPSISSDVEWSIEVIKAKLGKPTTLTYVPFAFKLPTQCVEKNGWKEYWK
jgi:hypothetical protein